MKKLRKHNVTAEIRNVSDELRMTTDAKGAQAIAGYAVVWDAPSSDLGFIEKIKRGAFTDSIAAGDQRLLLEHLPHKLLGKVSSKTLSLSEDNHGLKFNATLPKSPMGEDVAESIRRGDLSAMSFGFRVLPNGDEWGNTGKQVTRTVKKASLSEISVVSQAAYPSTSVNLRSCPSEIRSLLEEEDDDACNCDCGACLDGDCANCSNLDCTSDDCVDCPNQDDPEDRSLVVEHEDLARYIRLQLAIRS